MDRTGLEFHFVFAKTRAVHTAILTTFFRFSIFFFFIFAFKKNFEQNSFFHIFIFLHDTDTREERQRQTTTQTDANDKMTCEPWSAFMI